MSEDKRPTPEDALMFAEKAEWVLLAKSELHRLYRTNGGRWIVIPVADDEHSNLYCRHLAETIMSGMQVLLSDVRRSLARAKGFRNAGTALMVLGLLLMLWSIFGHRSEPITPDERRLVRWLVLLALALVPIALWFGNKVLGPRFFGLTKSNDNPLEVPKE